MLIPIKHENMAARRWPVVTLALIAINVLVFLFTMSSIDDESPQLTEVRNHILNLAAVHPELKMQAESQRLVDGFKQSHPDQWKAVQNPYRDVMNAYDAKIRMVEDRSKLQDEMDSLNAQFVSLWKVSLTEQYARSESLSRRHECVRCQDQDGRGSVEAAGRDGLAQRSIREPLEGVAYRAVRLRARESHGDQLPDGKFHARRLDAPDWQYVVPVARGGCVGRRLGTLAVLGVLSDCGCGSTAVLCLVESGEHHSDAGSLGRSSRTYGSVPGALPQDEDRDGVAAHVSPVPLLSCGVLADAPVAVW